MLLGFATPSPHGYFTRRWEAGTRVPASQWIGRAWRALVSDIFREVDEEVRRERLQQIWNRYGHVLVALALLIVIGVGGWRASQWWQAKKSAELGSQFEAALVLSEQNKHDEAQAAFDKIAAEGASAYRMLARFRAAQELARHDADGAVRAYAALAADSGIGQVMQDLAAIRAGLILVDSASYDDLRARLEPLTASDRAFRHTARELLALGAWRAGRDGDVKHWVDIIMTDAESPAAVRTRAEMLTTVTSGVQKG